MKTVEFNGVKFEVPDWAKYITLDDYGYVEVWDNPAYKNHDIYCPVHAPTTRYAEVGRIPQMERYKSIK